MNELINQRTEIEASKAVELSRIKEALAIYQETVLSIRNPDNLTDIELERFVEAGDRLIIEHDWPLARILDLYYGMRPDATKPELSTEDVAGIMVATDEDNKFNYWQREAYEDYEPTGIDSYTMPFGQRGVVDIDKLLPDSHKREPLPFVEKY